jgi:hypothetical protein
MNRLCLAVASFAFAWASVATPAESGDEIAGRVIDALTGNGIARARVTLTVNDARRFVLLTDEDGGFRVRHVPSIWISIWAERTGYLGDPLDPSTPESAAQFLFVRSADGARPLTLKLTPESVIEGKASDGKGAGVARVRLWKQDPHGAVAVQSEKNLDRTGEFRFAPLAAGRYYLDVSSVPASSSPDRHPVYLHRFYKEGATLQAATPIDVEPGQTKSVPLLLQPAQGHQIRGRVDCAEPNSASLWLSLVPDQIPFALGRWDSQTRTFIMSNVPPGEYLLKVNCTVDGKAVTPSMPITVSDSDLDGVVLSPSAP